jgi:hypothetical protein
MKKLLLLCVVACLTVSTFAKDEDEDQNKARLPVLQRKRGDLNTKIEKEEKELVRLLPKDKKGEVVELDGLKAPIPSTWKEEKPDNRMRYLQYWLPSDKNAKDKKSQKATTTIRAIKPRT